MSTYWPKDSDEQGGAAFMAPHSAPSIGLEAIRRAYEQLFARVDHMVTVEIEHIAMTADSSWAFVRTRCTGKRRVRATSEKLEDDVQGSWILRWLPSASEGQGSDH